MKISYTTITIARPAGHRTSELMESIFKFQLHSEIFSITDADIFISITEKFGSVFVEISVNFDFKEN